MSKDYRLMTMLSQAIISSFLRNTKVKIQHQCPCYCYSYRQTCRQLSAAPTRDPKVKTAVTGENELFRNQSANFFHLHLTFGDKKIRLTFPPSPMPQPQKQRRIHMLLLFFQKIQTPFFRLKSNVSFDHVRYRVCHNTLKVSSSFLPRPCFHILDNICHLRSNPNPLYLLNDSQRRFYTQSTVGKSTQRNYSQSKSDDSDSASQVDDSIRNDPWIKSLLADMRQDFDAQKQTSDVKAENVGMDPQFTDSVNMNKRESTDIERDYEYDYRYAGDDDIEEFGYFDEGDIVNDGKPRRSLPISLNRGAKGVFELEELVTLMEHLGAENIVSVPIPPEAKYCDHMVIVTAKSRRHLQALNDEMLWVHKRKKSKKDLNLHIEGKDKSEWCAMDMGNVVLHIFLTEERRQYYDIESLWLLGPDNDPKCREEQDPSSFALSAEELYWMEVGGAKAPKAEDETQRTT